MNIVRVAAMLLLAFGPAAYDSKQEPPADSKYPTPPLDGSAHDWHHRSR